MFSHIVGAGKQFPTSLAGIWPLGAVAFYVLSHGTRVSERHATYFTIVRFFSCETKINYANFKILGYDSCNHHKSCDFFSNELQPHSHMNPQKKNISLLN